MNHYRNIRIKLFSIVLFFPLMTMAQYDDFNTIKATIDFEDKIREWDGFGVNYVQTAHTSNYQDYAQEYGGFSILSEKEQDEIIGLIFGEEGLKVNLLKMFLDPLHQQEPGGPFDHETTTSYMVSFAKKGLEKLQERGEEMQIITTLYGPPAFMTKQKVLRGRDLDPAFKEDLALYMIDWAKYLQDQKLPVKYISLHNEGEDWRRWAADGTYANFDHGHDYNLYWRPEEVADFLAFMPELMEKEGLEGVKVTNGEASRWYQFYFSGYAREIYENPKALENIGLLTSHNFYRQLPPGHRWFCGTSNVGADLIRSKRPDLHAWVTSASWGDMDVDFVWQIYMNIYMAKANGYIPWAALQRPPHWVGDDPNPGTAFVINEDGSYKIQPGYYWYKTITRAGQAGMAVAYAQVMDSELQLMAFGQDDTAHPDAFSVINSGLSFIWRSDAVSVSVGDQYYYLSTKDPIATRDRHPEVEHHIDTTSTGYVVEMAIPLEAIDHKNADVSFNVSAREGAYSEAGKVGWRAENGKLVFADASQVNGPEVIIPKIDGTVTIDGRTDPVWDQVEKVSIDQKLHPNTQMWHTGTWQAAYDDQNLYLLVYINDKTHMMSYRRMEIELEGTEFTKFEVYRTSEQGELYQSLGTQQVKNGKLIYNAPSKSITTFIGVK